MSALVLNNDNFEQEVLNSDVPVVVDLDDAPEIAKKYRIMSVPSVLYFNKGEVVKRQVGASSKEDILAAVGAYL